MSKKVSKQSMVETMKGFLVNASAEAKKVIDYIVGEYEKNPRNVTMEDLKESLAIVKEMVQPSMLPVENSLKKSTGKADVKKEDKKVLPLKSKSGKTEEELMNEIEESLDTDEKEDGKDEAALDSTKKGGNTKKLTPKNKDKATDKKPETKVETPKETPKKEEKKEKVIKSVEMAASFPETFKCDLGTLKIRPDIKDIKELHNLVEEEVQLVLCVYWNKRQLKQFNYDTNGICAKYPKEFPNDLDVVDLIYASENGIVAYGVSLYTEAAVTFTADQFATDEETGMRYQNGAEYQVYEIVE